MIEYQVLSTGSAGNAVVVNRAVLIDCGVPYKAIEPFIKDLRLVLLTHIHGDHFKVSTIRKIAQERPLVRFGAPEWLIKPLMDAGVSLTQILLLKPGFRYDLTLCSIIPFPLVHDVPNCGYKVHFPGGKMIYATDTANMNGVSAPYYDLYMIEANYGDEEILKRINDKKATGQYAYEYRVLRTHLSQGQCNDWVYQNAGPSSEILYLHGHREDETDDDRGTEGTVQGL